jgi:hypothetical protein
VLQRRRKENGKQAIVVNFLQMTTKNKHGVSPGGFFAMFMFVKLIKINNLCDVKVNFFFIMPEESYDQFNLSEVDYLYYCQCFEKVYNFFHIHQIHQLNNEMNRNPTILSNESN